MLTHMDVGKIDGEKGLDEFMNAKFHFPSFLLCDFDFCAF